MPSTIKVDNGKYTFHVHDYTGRVSIDRFDFVDWIPYVDKGSKALIALIHHAINLQARIDELEAERSKR